MEVYAAGFNAHGQIFSSLPNFAAHGSDLTECDQSPNATKQLSPFRPVLSPVLSDLTGKTNVRLLLSLWSATVLEIDGQLWHYGQSAFLSSGRGTSSPETPPYAPLAFVFHSSVQRDRGGAARVIAKSDEIRSSFGDASGVVGAVAWDGSLHRCQLCQPSHRPDSHEPGDHERAICFEPVNISLGTAPSESVCGVAATESGEVCVCSCSAVQPVSQDPEEANEPSLLIRTWKSYGDLLGGVEKGTFVQRLPMESADDFVSLEASATAFIIHLRSPERILTFGSPLQPALLARPITATNSATQPAPIPFFQGIPSGIAKVRAGGWLSAALTTDRDLYMWGGRQGERCIDALQDVEGDGVVVADISVSPRNGGGGAIGADVVDVAVGLGHILALTSDGEVWGCGDNGFGQLDVEKAQLVEDWTLIHGPWEQSGEVVSVQAGGWGSFVTCSIVQEGTSER